MVDLERRVLELEPLAKHGLDPAADSVAVGARVDEHVRRERRKAGRDRPHVEVVHLDDARHGEDRAADVLGGHAARRRLQEDAHGLAEQPPGAGEHEHADEQRDERVGELPARHDDDDAGDDHAHRAPEVGEHVQQRPAHVEAVASRPVQHARRGEVHGEADRADHEHPAAGDVRWVGEAPRSLHEDPDRDDDEQDAVRERREDLGPPVAEAPLRRRRPPGEPGREQGERQRGGVGEHVPGVGQDGQRVGEQPDDDLHDEEARDERQRDRERLPVGAQPRVLVAVRVHALRLARQLSESENVR